mgnify:CR=1 FL=1
MIRIEVPATSANLGSGFDSLGLALTMYNQVWMEEADGVEIISRDGLSIPVDESNLIYWSAKKLYERCSRSFPACHIEQQSEYSMAQRPGQQLGLYCGGTAGS